MMGVHILLSCGIGGYCNVLNRTEIIRRTLLTKSLLRVLESSLYASSSLLVCSTMGSFSTEPRATMRGFSSNTVPRKLSHCS